MNNNWYSFRNDLPTPELNIFGPIGGWFGEPIENLLEQVTSVPVGAPINVYIDSDGGDYLDALALHNLLARRVTTVNIAGRAISAASVIALSGERIIMPENAWMMIHNISLRARMDVDSAPAYVELLNRFHQQIIDIYVARTGNDAEQIDEWLRAETWMNGADALERGFVTEVVSALRLTASNVPQENGHYRNLPQAVADLQATLSVDDTHTETPSAATPVASNENGAGQPEQPHFSSADETPPGVLPSPGGEVSAAVTAEVVPLATQEEISDLIAAAGYASPTLVNTMTAAGLSADQVRAIAIALNEPSPPIPMPVSAKTPLDDGAHQTQINVTSIYRSRNHA